MSDAPDADADADDTLAEKTGLAVASAAAERVALTPETALSTAELTESVEDTTADDPGAEVDEAEAEEDAPPTTALVALATIDASGTESVALATIDPRPSTAETDALALALELALELALVETALEVEFNSETDAAERAASEAEAEADDEEDEMLADSRELELDDEAETEAEADEVAEADALNESVELSAGPNSPEMTLASDCTLPAALSLDDADADAFGSDKNDGAVAGTELAPEVTVADVADEADEAIELASELSDAEADARDAIDEERLEDEDDDDDDGEDAEVDTESSPEAETRKVDEAEAVALELDAVGSNPARALRIPPY